MYPEISLRNARELREARSAPNSGRDPALEGRRARQTRREGHTGIFERYATARHELRKSRWKEVHAADVIDSMRRDLFPVIGAFPVGDIDERLLLAALRPVERRGVVETAHRLRQRAERVFRYAAGAGALNANPAVNVRDALAPVPPKRRWPAITEAAVLERLAADVDRAAASPVTRLCPRLIGLAAQRPGTVRAAAWTEFETIDWDGDAVADEAVWRIPAARMKIEPDLRENEAFEHVVPLAPTAVDVLRAIRPLTGRGPLAFAGGRDAHSPLSENAVGYLYNREGWRGRHVPHGWRSSFSTIMNGRAERAQAGADRLVIDRLIIDLMLAHVPTGMSSTEFRYDRQGYLEPRREPAEEWAELIFGQAAPATELLKGRRRSAVRKGRSAQGIE